MSDTDVYMRPWHTIITIVLFTIVLGNSNDTRPHLVNIEMLTE